MEEVFISHDMTRTSIAIPISQSWSSVTDTLLITHPFHRSDCIIALLLPTSISTLQCSLDRSFIANKSLLMVETDKSADSMLPLHCV